jgi:hypothetical protein
VLSWVVSSRSTLRRSLLLSSLKSLRLNSFADPHPLNPVLSYRYKKAWGSARMDLSPLKCAVADKHRVLPVFSRNRPAPIPLDATLTRVLVSVHSKQFTGKLSYLESALTENTGGGLRPLQRATRRSYLAAALKPFPFMLLRTLLHRAKSQPLYFQAFPHSCPKTPGVGVSPNVQTSRRSSGSPVPLRRKAFGATICKGAGFLHHPGKQLRSPRCLRIVSGHRELFDGVPDLPRPGRGRKSCLGPAF